MTSARRFALRILTATAVCTAAFAPVPAAAQEPAATFNALAARVATGATLTVATDDGRKVTGRLRQPVGRRHRPRRGRGETIQAQGVKTVAARGKRPVMKGFLIGLAGGADSASWPLRRPVRPQRGRCADAAPTKSPAPCS